MAIKSLNIPPRAQAPVAVALGLLLVALMAYKSGRFQPKEWFSFDKSAGDVELEAVSMDEMMILISDATESIAESTNEERVMPALERNPFQRPLFAQADIAVQPTAINDNSHRATVLHDMELIATLQMGGFAAALVDGNYIRKGDVYKGFEVVSIGERVIVLEDGRGRETLRMPEESLL